MVVEVSGDLVGAADPIAEHVAVIMIIAVIILVINVIKDTIITILEDLVVIPAEVVTSEVVIAITEVVTAITEIVTVEVDTQIAIHVPVHIQALVGDLATNAITLVDGGEMALVTAPILENHQILEKQSPLQIMVVLLILVMPEFFFKE